jgi:GNAT superfamily N-acetyltransferase
MWPFIAHHWSGARAAHWSLEYLAVDPRYQGRGDGRELVRWELERARSERVVASVIVADGKEGFYRRRGFDEFVGWATERVENPGGEAGVRGGAILFRDVEGDKDGES